jgi:tetratricopeptide (TPR) repeat protein
MRTWRTAGVAMAVAGLVAASGCETVQQRQTMDRANKLFAAKQYEQAIPEYQKIVKSDPDHWQANYYLAMSWLAQFHPQSTHPKDAEIKKQAVGQLEKLMTLTPPGPEEMDKVRNYYLSLLTSAGDNEKAVGFLEKRIREEPNNKELIAQVAQLQAKVGNFDESLRWYEKIAAMEPNDKTHWYTIAVLCWERSNKAGITISPDERTTIIQRGIDSIDKALALDTEYTEAIAYKNLLFREKADALSKAGRFEEAQAAFAESVKLRDQAIELMKKKKAQAAAAPAAS